MIVVTVDGGKFRALQTKGRVWPSSVRYIGFIFVSSKIIFRAFLAQCLGSESLLSTIMILHQTFEYSFNFNNNCYCYFYKNKTKTKSETNSHPQ